MTDTLDTSSQNIVRVLGLAEQEYSIMAATLTKPSATVLAAERAAECRDLADALKGQSTTQELVAWEYELAQSLDERGGYGHWGPKTLSHKRPNVPDGSVRNLRPLFAAAPGGTENG